jgi:pectate lyase
MFFVLAAAAPVLAGTPAFPGAEGFGSVSTGGRGGEVYHVTTLADGGPGSLRDGVSKDHRTIVFDVGGYIMLKSVLQVASNITIAGQTAPGDGIGIGGAEVSLSRSHDLIIRYVRIRQGLSPGEDKKSSINVVSGVNLILDHVSVAWGRWDTIDMNLCDHVTVQYCMIGPGVAPQRFGCLCQSQNVTFTHNLWISNQSRNPKGKGKIQYINNVVYNWGVTGLVGGHSGADHIEDVIGNYFIAGPSSSPHFVGEFLASDHDYQTGNYVDLNKDGTFDGRPVTPADFGQGKGAPTLMPAPTITDAPPETIDTAPAAYEKVVAGAGDSMHRDQVDQKLIADVRSLGLKGSTIDDPAEMGGFGQIKGGPAPHYTGGGGIPDDWATAHGLKPGDPAAENRVDKEGYTMVEEYLNSLAQAKGQ